MKGGFDWLMLFDGRNRETLSRLQKLMQGRLRGNELMLLFVGTGRVEAGRTRRVAFGANNIETVLVFPPWARNAMKSKPRTKFNLPGETSTHDVTYSGIPFRSRKSIPRISVNDKEAIVEQNSPAGVPDSLLHAFPHPPLFWQEAKPIQLYEQMLADYDVRSIFDVSPGSGALAEAAMALGITYVGVTTRPTHAKWLNNVLDRAVLSHITMPGRPCHQTELAGDVQKYFSDILLAAADIAAGDDVDVDMDTLADQALVA